MRTYQKFLAVIALSGLCLMPATASENAGAVKKSRKPARAEKAEAKPPCEACEAVKRLEEKVAAQQAEIDALKAAQQAAQPTPPTADEEARRAAAEAQRKADEAAAAAAAASAQANAANTTAGKAQESANAATAQAQSAEKKAAALEEPAYVHYKGVKITPGGYGQFASIYRTHNANSDTASSFGTYPLSGSANSHVNEWRESGRASRLWLRVEGEAKNMKMLGYVETDFLGTTPNATESATNSYALRVRVAYGSVAFRSGWRITGGQTYSLLTLNRVAADPLTEALPAVIDNSFMTGFSYARQGAIRVSKSIGSHAWLAISAENPETVTSVNCLQVATTGVAVVPASCSLGAIVQGLQNTALTNSPTSFAAGVTPSNDVAPDLMAKVVVEPGWGHFEVVALGRFFRDRIYPATAIGGATPVGIGHNEVNAGGGLGFGAVLPVVPKKVDIVLHALGGKGIGRYGSAAGPDVTVKSDFSLVPIKGLQLYAGIELHPTPKLDLFVYGGDEYYGKTNYTIAQTVAGVTNTYVIGYGAQEFLNGGCNTEFPSTTATSALQCQSSVQNRNLWEVTPGFWYRLYKGKEGTVQFGVQYAYNYRRTWTGTGATPGTLAKPVAIENTVMTAFRYYLP